MGEVDLDAGCVADSLRKATIKRAYWKGWRGKLSRVLKLVVWTFLVVALGLVALLIWSGLGVNEWIDLCADETSGRYIFDEAKRRAKCE